MNFTAKDLREIALNASLQSIDDAVKLTTATPEMQMGILMMAQVLAFRRVLTKAGRNRGMRHRLLKLATRDFESKLRQFALDHEEPATPAATPAAL